jgi:hypothetical protein
MFKNFQALILITLILASAFLWAARPAPAQAMRRESGPTLATPATLDEALNLSLAYGDSRRINWKGLGF